MSDPKHTYFVWSRSDGHIGSTYGFIPDDTPRGLTYTVLADCPTWALAYKEVCAAQEAAWAAVTTKPHTSTSTNKEH